jgi:hypothetical protein
MVVFSVGVIGQKIGFRPKILDFHPILPRVYSADIRYETWADSKSGWVRWRIKFSIEWWYFQWGSSGKK